MCSKDLLLKLWSQQLVLFSSLFLYINETKNYIKRYIYISAQFNGFKFNKPKTRIHILKKLRFNNTINVKKVHKNYHRKPKDFHYYSI